MLDVPFTVSEILKLIGFLTTGGTSCSFEAALSGKRNIEVVKRC